MNRIAKTLLAAVAATTALGAQAWADTRGETFTFRVEAASLTSDVQVRTAYQRLGQEADRYCRALGIDTARERAACSLDVVDNVVKAVDHEALSELHVRRTQSEQSMAGAN